MIFQTRFSIGDKVDVLRRHPLRVAVKCEECAGDGVFRSAHGAEKQCYQCNGGVIMETRPGSAWMVDGRSYTVGLVRAEKHSFASPTEEYMLVETGVGSGTVYPSDSDHTHLVPAGEGDRVAAELNGGAA